MENSSFPVILLIAISIWFWNDHSSLTKQVETLNERVSYLSSEVNTYSDELGQANSNIDDAKNYAWSSYEEMGDALDSLETVNH